MNTTINKIIVYSVLLFTYCFNLVIATLFCVKGFIIAIETNGNTFNIWALIFQIVSSLFYYIAYLNYSTIVDNYEVNK